jgi:hypothetical protein
MAALAPKDGKVTLCDVADYVGRIAIIYIAAKRWGLRDAADIAERTVLVASKRFVVGVVDR